MMKKLLSILCLLALTVGLVPSAPAAEPEVTLTAGGWYETISAELTGVADGDVDAVSYTDISGKKTDLTGDDLKYLVRDKEGGGVRIDIPGVKAGTYSLSVTVGEKTYSAWNFAVKAYDRSGFAHKVHTRDASGNITGIKDYTEGVGAYNDDGTLKDNATVLYVTEATKETVSLTVTNDKGAEITVTGIGNILNCKGFDQPLRKNGGGAAVNASGKILAKMASAKRPLVVRIVGEVTKPQGVTAWNSTDNGGTKGDNGGMCIMEYGGNITIEGVGPDATVNGWGFSFSADGTGRTAEKNNKRDGWGENIEVRNLTFRNVPEDCIGITGAQDEKDGFKDSAEHVWVHNNSFYGPHGLPDASSEKDKGEGDGAVDFRNGEYMTMSYNYFYDYHKTSLIGSDDGIQQYHITWHHNWWHNVWSRMPLCRQADMHIYNNLYEVEDDYEYIDKISYCMSLRDDCYVYSENNTFRNCKNPVRHEGGVCKTKGDVFDANCTGTNDAAATVTSANPYANFETSPTLGYSDHKLQTAAEAEETVRAEAGTMKAGITAALDPEIAVERGDLGQMKWAYTEQGEVLILGSIPEGAKLFAAGYETGDHCLKAAPIQNGKAALGADMAKGKLFWLDENLAPVYPATGWGEAK